MGVVMLLQRGEKCGRWQEAFILQKETSSFTDYSEYISSFVVNASHCEFLTKKNK